MSQATLEKPLESISESQAEELPQQKEETLEGVAMAVIDAEDIDEEDVERFLEKAGGEEQGVIALKDAAMRRIGKEVRSSTKADVYDPAGKEDRATALRNEVVTAGEEVDKAVSLSEKKETMQLTATEVRDAIISAEEQGGASGVEALGELLQKIIDARQGVGEESSYEHARGVEIGMRKVVEASITKSEKILPKKLETIGELQAAQEALGKQLSHGLPQEQCNKLTDTIGKQIKRIEDAWEDLPSGAGKTKKIV
ncbi:MAG: hypothetical protein Q7S16_04400 [bacterium]|nr:hypothetical protein [bacterium]